jgi:hypothetical protein
LGLSAVAVESDIVGSDNEAELIGTVGFGGGVDRLAATRAACAADGSALDLGDVEKNWVIRLVLDVEFLIGMPPFSADDELLEGDELLEKGLEGRRGIARRSCWVEKSKRYYHQFKSSHRVPTLGFKSRKNRGACSQNVSQFPARPSLKPSMRSDSAMAGHQRQRATGQTMKDEVQDIPLHFPTTLVKRIR